MLAENPYTGVSQAFQMASGPVKTDLGELMNHQQYYTTPEVGRELKHIDNGINHIRLDNSFLETSRDWPHKFDRATLAREKQGGFFVLMSVLYQLVSSLYSDIHNHLILCSSHMMIFEQSLG